MVENQNLDNFRQFRHFLSNFYFCEKFSSQLKQIWVRSQNQMRRNTITFLSAYEEAQKGSSFNLTFIM